MMRSTRWKPSILIDLQMPYFYGIPVSRIRSERNWEPNEQIRGW